MPLRYIDLCAGLGGFHLALKKMGHECVFASELKEDLRKLYAINFPGCRIEGDLTKIEPKDIPAHDILCAGFPCQPFSQAGKREGFEDERGNIFNYICKIIRYHRPRYILLENVSNLKGHDNGNTWRTIYHKLHNELRYDVPEPAILSPHQFGIPQHRKRIYIIAADPEQVDISGFRFPEPTKEPCDIKRMLDETSTDYIKIKTDTRHQLDVWQEFIELTVANGQEIPRFPIWAMEFGANYPIDKAPATMSPDRLIGCRGKLGRIIPEGNMEDCIALLPKYAQSDKPEIFPDWKISYIMQNRKFYEDNKKWLDKWLKKVARFENSHLKLEWNCGKDATPTLWDKIIQFRASGIRVKLPNFSPALNLVGTQVPILPWIKLPEETLEKGEPSTGRYMTVEEAAKLQGMEELTFGNEKFHLAKGRCYEALGNAVNVDIVHMIAQNLLPAYE